MSDSYMVFLSRYFKLVSFLKKILIDTLLLLRTLRIVANRFFSFAAGIGTTSRI